MTKKNNLTSMNHLRHLGNITDSNLMINCILNSREQFVKHLNNKLEPHNLIMILKLLVPVYNAEEGTNKNEVLEMTLCEPFINSILNYLLIVNTGQIKRSVFTEDLKYIVIYFDVMINILPILENWYIKFKYLFEVALGIICKGQLQNHPIKYWIDDLYIVLGHKIDSINRENRTYVESSVFPDPIDFFEKKEYRAKEINYKYNSFEEYLDNQFNLLKQDYVSAVKEGIYQFKRELRGVEKTPNSFITVYENVKVNSVEVNQNPRQGIFHYLIFSAADEMKLEYDLLNNNKFLHGSLLYFTTFSSFTNFALAVVHDIKKNVVCSNGIKHVALQVSVIGNPFSLEIGKLYLMFETSIYFEPYHRVLKALQSISPSKFFMKNYIINKKFDSSLPGYLEKDTYYTIDKKKCSLSDIKSWPKLGLNLNESQLAALKAALTKEFTLIQGPPGTGKTHVVRKIIEVLVSNRKYRSSPILFVCYRNDSLDNVLESLVACDYRVLRFGRQTKSDIMKHHLLPKIRINWKNKKNLVARIKLLKDEMVSESKQKNLNANISSLESNIKMLTNLCDVDIANEIIASDYDIIGATTTGAAKLYTLLQCIQPEVVIIEEAGELLEAHTLISIPQGCKHVILIGDHKQLQPTPAHKNSAEKYKMHISLFEKLIENGMHSYMLTEQFRMRPEIASLISPLIYKNLTNHISVNKYPMIKGVAKNMFFLDHTHPERKVVNLYSLWNKHEADFLLAFAHYLILQGYSSNDITILTGYKAQVNYLTESLIKHPSLNDIQISSIDNYQGEENNIILLSLVRSETQTIGFLRKYNRVNVAISRAKHGLYMIGNMDTLVADSVLWKNMQTILKQMDAIDNKLPLECQIHKSITHVRKENDFKELMLGGCNLPCSSQLPCGHVCKYPCHPSQDREHQNYICREPCQRSPCGRHKCELLCCEECQRCTLTVDRFLKCGHIVQGPCSVDLPLEDIKCKNPCDRSPCGKHKCKLLCYQQCPKCTVMVDHSLECGHTVQAPCSMALREIICRSPCNRKCNNGHACKKLCFEECGICEIPTRVMFFFCCRRMRPCHKVKPFIMTVQTENFEIS